MHATSGTGKTTLANNLDTFLPGIFAPTLSLNGAVDADTLHAETLRHIRDFPVNDKKIIPINIDHREGSPPNSTELASIKRFLRQQGTGHKALILWPETSADLSNEMAEAYLGIAGRAPISLPLKISGPPRETWIDIAKSTLRLANSLESLEDLGVQPANYKPEEFASIGEFLRTISDEFSKLTSEMLRATRMPLRLAIIFASESSDAGVLTHLTSSNRFGLLDGNALLDASPESEVGRWWSKRRGLLTSAIVRLDARVFGLHQAPLLVFCADSVQKESRSSLQTWRCAYPASKR
jgi:energy-coupling factor transporter ATP-binding protein EcfA2